MQTLARRDRTWPQRAAALGAGAVAALGFYGNPFLVWQPWGGLATVAGLTALVLFCARAPRRAAGLGWCWGWSQFFIGCHWIAQAFEYQAKMPPWIGWLTVAGLAALLATMPALACWLAWSSPLRKRMSPWWSLPAAWMLTEWIRVWLFTGFPWNPIAAAFLGDRATGMADGAAWVGAIGLSGIVVLAAAGLARALGDRRMGIAPALTVIALVGVAAVPGGRLTASKRVELVIVQPNIGQEVKWQADSLAFQAERLTSLSRQAPPPKPGVPRLILWPEVALPGLDLQRDAQARAALTTLLRPGDLLLTGANTFRLSAAGEVTGATNSLLALDSAGRVIGQFDKFHLVPAGEYVPLRPIADVLGLSRLAPGSIDFTPGPGPRTLSLPGVPDVGPLICYEIIFPARIVDEDHRPAWLLNPSNDAWFGRDGPPQALAQARLRAIEEGLPIARSTPTGISALIGPRGEVLAALPQRVAGALTVELPAPREATVFGRFGHLTTALLGLLFLGVGAWEGHRRI
ncbi:MAG: apolipoprotein N-acyltransferase [Sphingomonadaceae bacterium]|nr:apolipoprotein N-acyltransferase [Sphingomonadaceae bacterium]